MTNEEQSILVVIHIVEFAICYKHYNKHFILYMKVKSIDRSCEYFMFG